MIIFQKERWKLYSIHAAHHLLTITHASQSQGTTASMSGDIDKRLRSKCSQSNGKWVLAFPHHSSRQLDLLPSLKWEVERRDKLSPKHWASCSLRFSASCLYNKERKHDLQPPFMKSKDNSTPNKQTNKQPHPENLQKALIWSFAFSKSYIHLWSLGYFKIKPSCYCVTFF